MARAFACLDVSNIYTTPKKSARLLILAVCMCGMVNYQVYNAGLISSLMVQRYELPINRLDDILAKPAYKLLFAGDAAHESFLKNSNLEKYQAIWKKTNHEKGILLSEADGEKQILEDDKKILLSLSPDFEMMFETYPCEVVSSKTTYSEFPAGYIFSKDSNFLSLFSHHVQTIAETGLETEWFDGQKYSSIECSDDNDRHFITLSYHEVISAFYLLVLGSLLAVANMMLEYGYQNWFL